MIGKLKGLVDFISDSFIILDVGGVGYRVFCSAKTLQKLPKIGEAVSLWIETNVREDHIHLYGFLSEEEKNFFNLLTSVQGLGLKGGQALLSVFQPEELALVISAADTKQITRAPGIGPKLAARIVTELKGKTDLFKTCASLSSGQTSFISSSTVQEAVSALVNLGYMRTDAAVVVSSLYQENKDADLQTLIRLSLRKIGQMKNG
jgi:holliday junction DNA helicase RuvA